MKQLDVKLVRQPEDSNECGVACVSMIADFYNLQLEYSEIKDELGVYSWGTTTPQLGRFFLNHGFDVEIIGLHPALFQSGVEFKDSAELLQYLRKMRTVLKDGYDAISIEHFIEFVKEGGGITPRIPTVMDIETELAAESPVLIPLSHWFLHQTTMPPRFSIHFNVISGVHGGEFTVHDPDWGSDFGGIHNINKDLLMYAMYVSAKGGIDDACIMKIKKR